MGKAKENPRYNVLTLRCDDYTLAEMRERLNGVSVSAYIHTALEEKITRDRQDVHGRISAQHRSHRTMTNQSPITNHQSLTVQGFPLRTGPGGAYLPKTAQGIQSLAAWSNENVERRDHWLIDEIARGFKKLLLLRLDGAPAAELIAMTAELWVDTIGYGLNAEQDAERIAHGFRLLQGKIKRWPQPVELMGILPTRMKAASRTAAMEAPLSDEAHAKGVAAFDEILEKLKS